MLTYDNTSVSLGEAAANRLENAISEKGVANLLLATGASQFDFLEALQKKALDWFNITTFHLDEYVGIKENHSASFRKYLHDRIIDTVQPAETYFLRGDADDLQAEINRYEQLLKTHPIDVACIGIGENGHLAFNDPLVAVFDDPTMVKIVDLDDRSRWQQVGEGWFDNIEEVPKQALTLTIPTIMQSHIISCVVPEKRKAEAVFNTLYGPITTDCPASVLRAHPDATLFLDAQSAWRVKTKYKS